jgi:hypothetical protein
MGPGANDWFRTAGIHNQKDKTTDPAKGRIMMQKQDHRQIAAACGAAAVAAKSQGDRQQLLQIQKKHLALAEQEDAGLSNGHSLIPETKAG